MNLLSMLRIIVVLLFLTIAAIWAFGQAPIQGQVQWSTNAEPAGPVEPGVIEGTTNKALVQPWTVRVVQHIVILHSQRTEWRVMLTNQPLLSVTNPVSEPLGPPAPRKRK